MKSKMSHCQVSTSQSLSKSKQICLPLQWLMYNVRLRIYETEHKGCLIQSTSCIPPICSSSLLNPVCHKVCFKGTASHNSCKDLIQGGSLNTREVFFVATGPKAIHYLPPPLSVLDFSCLCLIYISIANLSIFPGEVMQIIIPETSKPSSFSCQEANAVIVHSLLMKQKEHRKSTRGT